MSESTGLPLRIALAFDEGQVLNGGHCVVYDESYKQKSRAPGGLSTSEARQFEVLLFKM
jgi:hypothetical protein